MAGNVNNDPSPPPSPILYEGQGEEDAPQMSEEAILDQLFLSCVTDNDTAPVEDIITKVRGVVSAENQNYVLELFDRMMRNSAIEGCVDFSSFQQVIQQWVEAVKRQSSVSPSPRSDSSLSISQMSESSHSEVDYDNPVMEHAASHNFTLETTGGESFVDPHNELDLVHSVQQLEYANERLTEQNHKLQLQMESSEERMADVASENEELKRKLRQTQQTLEQRNSLVSDLRKELDHHQSQEDIIDQLKKENKRLQDDITTANLQLEQLKQEMTQLEQSQADHSQQEGSHNDINLQNLKYQLEEMETQNENLTAALNDLNETHEVLRAEKQELDTKVVELEMELANKPVSNQLPAYASTPYTINGRCLKDEIADHFPAYNNNGSLDDSETSYYAARKEEDSVDRLLGSLSPIPGETHDLSSMDHFSIITSQARSQFRQKKELAMKQIAELFANDPSNNMESRKESLRQQLEDDMLSFEGKLSQLSQSKHTSEKRVGRLIDYIKKLKAEIKQLSEKGDAAEPDESEKVHETTEDQMSCLEKELADTKAELDQLTNKIQQLNSTIKQQEKKLKKAGKLEEDAHVTIATLTKDLSITKAKCTQLEESLDVTVTRHREELDDIMELVLSETTKADQKLPAALSMSTSDEGDHGDRSLPPTSERIKELVSSTINRVLSALSLSSGNLRLLKWADGAQVSLAESDEDESLDANPKLVTPTEQYVNTRSQSISEQRFALPQQKPDSDATPSGATTTDDITKKRAKLVYQKISIDEEPISLDQSSHSLSTDHETSHEQFPDNQTQDQASHDQESQDMSSDHQKDLQASDYSDIRSPSFMSLQNEGCVIQTAKQRKGVVLEQPIPEEIITPIEEMKEGDEPSSHVKEETDAPSEVLHKEADDDSNKTPLGETKEEGSSSHTKEETNAAASDLLQVPSSGQQQQYRSLSVPSCPPQLKSILRRSNAPKSLSLDIHNIDDVPDSSSDRPPLVHKMSVQFTETHQMVTVTPLSSTWEGHQPWMAVSPGTPYPLPTLSSPPPISLSETRELSFLSEEAQEDIDSLSAEVVANRVKNMLVAMDTDNYTLPKRRTDYLHAKETAIEDADEELETLSKELIEILRSSSTDQVQQLNKHIDIVSQSIKIVATKAEQHGCLLQEYHYSLCIKLLKRHISDLVAAKESLEARLQTCLLPDDRKHSRSISCVSAISFSSNDSGSIPRLYSTNNNQSTSAASEQSDASPSPSPEPCDHLDNIQAVAYQKGMDTGLQYNLANLRQREKECVAKCRTLSSTVAKLKNDQQKILLAKEKTDAKPLWGQLITLIHMILLFLLLTLLILSFIGTFVWINDEERSVYCSPSSRYDRYPLPYYLLQFFGIDTISIMSL